ncbi:hypothetical protein [Natrinema longum]|uniref:Uncharacterized protein n=1 Tax=Natrinema longum TaxID=370324 RepID=A0A8A2U861_9EURY|nr:hypothetical protein [Natrinema longum]MBZ6493771.1 hypothetical protein [Natrinema longum]QSW84891.1 hypothetical protein J0X27_15790 [Natrinema longum]
MEHISRRRLLAIAGAGTGFTALGAGCLDQSAETDTDEPNDTTEPDGADEPDDTSASDRPPLERWVPASGSAELGFRYRDLTTVRAYEEHLQSDVVESIPSLPRGEHAEIVERLADGESAIDSVLRFGSADAVGNVVVSGSFDSDPVDADLESAAGEFAVFERDGTSVAVSEETVVVSDADGADIDAILAAGVEGTDRRVDADVTFATTAEQVAQATFVRGEHDRRDETDASWVGIANAWSLGSETTTHSIGAVYDDADTASEFETQIPAAFDDEAIELDGTVGVATRTVPTEDYEYRNRFAERGTQPAPPQAGVTIESDASNRTVTVTYVSRSRTDRLEIRDESGNSDEMTEVGETTTFEYEAGASGEITVVGVRGETKAVVAAHSYSF